MPAPRSSRHRPLSRKLFATAARNLHDYVELMPVRPFYRLCWEDGYRFDYTDDLEAINRQIALKSPADVEGYARFRRYAEEVFVEGYEKLAHVPVPRLVEHDPGGPAAVASQELSQRL